MCSTHSFLHGKNKSRLSWSSLNSWLGMSLLQLIFGTFWLSRLEFLNLHLWVPQGLEPPCLELQVCQELEATGPVKLIFPWLGSDLSPRSWLDIWPHDLWSGLLSSVRVVSRPLWHIPVPGIRAIPVPCGWCPLPPAPSPDTLLMPPPFNLLLSDGDPHLSLHDWRLCNWCWD